MVYMLKFSHPLGTDRHRAQHCLGYCEDGRLHLRLYEHRIGQGAAITRAAIQRAHTLEVVATWPGGDRPPEHKLKSRKCHRGLIPRLQAVAP